VRYGKIIIDEKCKQEENNHYDDSYFSHVLKTAFQFGY
jgi:hypothetical protein